MRQVHILFLLLLMNVPTVFGSSYNLVDSVKQETVTHDGIRFIDGVTYTVSSPLRWKGKDWINLGGVIGGTALLTLVDKPVRNFWQDRDSKIWDGVERAGFHYGKPYAAFIMTGGFYLTGLVIKNEWARETGLMLGAAYLTTGAMQTLMKTAVGRARPGTNVGPWAFDPFSPEAGYHSFPSGHIQIATVSAMVLGHRVKSPILKVVFYGAAGVTLASRMYSDAHWLSDMAFGGAMSWFCTRTIVRRMEKTKYDNPFKKKDKISWNISPMPRGISLVGNF